MASIPTIAIVIPTIRTLDFLSSWGNQFARCIGIITEDHPCKQIETPDKYFWKTYHYSWKEIDADLKKNAWIISRKNAGIRSYGFLKAQELGADIVITIDDDCLPHEGVDLVEEYIANLSLFAPDDWFPIYPNRKYMYSRGIPYSIRNKHEVVLSHGLWSEVLDFDSPTNLINYGLRVPQYFEFLEFIPKGYYFPMSTNLAYKKEIACAMYFPPMGAKPGGALWGVDRYDDIWAGLFVKKIIDHLGFAVSNGSPFIRHTHASDVFNNIEKEAKGLRLNEDMYTRVERVQLTAKTVTGCYAELAKKIEFPADAYFKDLRKAMRIWSEYF